MRKIPVLLLLLLSACVFDHVSCISVSEFDRNTAKSYYPSWGATLVEKETYNRVKKKFSCNYRPSDYIYSYKTFLDTKYILVRDGEAVTYIEE
jgi:hypothetical protein